MKIDSVSDDGSREAQLVSLFQNLRLKVHVQIDSSNQNFEHQSLIIRLKQPSTLKPHRPLPNAVYMESTRVLEILQTWHQQCVAAMEDVLQELERLICAFSSGKGARQTDLLIPIPRASAAGLDAGDDDEAQELLDAAARADRLLQALLLREQARDEDASGDDSDSDSDSGDGGVRRRRRDARRRRQRLAAIGARPFTGLFYSLARSAGIGPAAAAVAAAAAAGGGAAAGATPRPHSAEVADDDAVSGSPAAAAAARAAAAAGRARAEREARAAAAAADRTLAELQAYNPANCMECFYG
jgi:hypothetical protein